MSGVLRIPPEQMHQEAAKLHGIAQDLKDAHERAHGRVSDLLGSFGESETRSALAARLEAWEEETRSHHQHLTTHADNRRTLANEFVAADALNANVTGKIAGQGNS